MSAIDAVEAQKPVIRAGIKFRPEVGIEPDGSDPKSLRVTSPVGNFLLHRLTPGLCAAVRQLVSELTAVESLRVALSDDELAQLDRVLVRLQHLVVRCILDNDRVVLRFERVSTTGSSPTVINWSPTVPDKDEFVRLTKFAFLRRRGEELVLESPQSAHRAALVDPAISQVIGRLSCATRIGDIVMSDRPRPEIGAVIGELIDSGLVEVGRRNGDSATFESDEDPVFRQWDFHDLLFHSRSRFGRYDDPFGGVFPYVGELDPQPATKRAPGGPSIALPRPEWHELIAHDPKLTAVLEARQSIRKYAEKPITRSELGEFLYRVGRVRARYGPGDGIPYEVATRPYPCGGGAYELELYLTVRRCAGVAEGIYYYDPVDHQLVIVNESQDARSRMLQMATTATGGAANPDVLITITSRFQRLSWKYRAIAYAVTLRHVGVLYQTMYLVATAMNLAPCGLGSGNSDLAAEAFGLDYLHESSVGDFILGSRPNSSSGTPGRPRNWRPVNDSEWADHAISIINRDAREQ